MAQGGMEVPGDVGSGGGTPLRAHRQLQAHHTPKPSPTGRRCRRKGWHPELASWQFMHAFCFVLGGTTFVAGAGRKPLSCGCACLIGGGHGLDGLPNV